MEKSKMTIAESPAVKYAEWCIEEDNRKAPKYVKKQCQVFLDIVFGRDNEAYADEKAFRLICKVLKLIIHPDLHKPLLKCLEGYA